MPRRLLLDGDDLPTLMQRVRAEMGPDAVVVKAERVRTGGVAGFFAKEHFEVTVEVPDRPAARPRPGGGRPAPVGMAALLDAADAGDLGGAPPAPVTARSGEAPTAPAPGPRPAGAPRVSTDGDTFASLLASIDGMTETHPAPAADAEKPAHPAARFAPQGATVTAATFAPFSDPDTDVPGTAAPDSAPGTGVPGAAGGPRGPVTPARPASPARPTAPAADGPPSTRAGVPSDAHPVVFPPTRPTSRPDGGGDRRSLLDLGVPSAVLGVGPLDEPLPLSRLLGALPRPPAPLKQPGTVLVVVGEGSGALPVASQLAQRARLDPQDVVLAGAIDPVSGHGRRLLSPAAAARHRAKLGPTDPVSIVALGVGPEAEDWAAAAALLAELAPDQSWAVVDARRKASDLRAWMHGIAAARPFDVVAAAWVHETQEPGTVLDLGAPVGWLDGLPATPVVWAAVLSERLDAGARWD